MTTTWKYIKAELTAIKKIRRKTKNLKSIILLSTTSWENLGECSFFPSTSRTHPKILPSAHLTKVNCKQHFLFESIPQDSIHLASFKVFSFDSIFQQLWSLDSVMPLKSRFVGHLEVKCLKAWFSNIKGIFKLIRLSFCNKTFFFLAFQNMSNIIWLDNDSIFCV